MKAPSFPIFTITVLACTLSFAGVGRAGMDPVPPSLEVLMESAGYSDKQRNEFLAGGIIATDVERAHEKELRAVVAMTVPATLEQIVKHWEEGRSLTLDPEAMVRRVSYPVDEAEWAELAFTDADRDEVKALLRVKAGDKFNLSTEEIAAFRELRETYKEVTDDGASEAVSHLYHQILMDRLTAYAEKGLDGIAPYDRDGDFSSPADELRAVADPGGEVLNTYFPEFRQLLLDYPKGQTPETFSNFYWTKDLTEGRSSVVLTHHMLRRAEDYLLISRREFYVGHTYNSLQMLALAIPVESGTAVFMLNATSTDQITGFFSGVAKSVGQSRMRESLTSFFEELRADERE